MAAMLCPEQVQLHSIDQMPACDPAACAVMFPCDDALLPDQLDLQQLQRVVILDSKWAKAKELNEHPALRGMQRVRLPGSPKSCFWRFHTSGVTDEGVCTIEALHLLLTAVAAHLPDPAQRDPHCFDNLLWYFAFQHQLVARKAAERQQKKMQQQHQEGQLEQGCGSQQQQPRYPQQPGKRGRKQPGGAESRQQQQQQQHSSSKGSNARTAPYRMSCRLSAGGPLRGNKFRKHEYVLSLIFILFEGGSAACNRRLKLEGAHATPTPCVAEGHMPKLFGHDIAAGYAVCAARWLCVCAWAPSLLM
ncbi:hypothetical protein COO60DRAFT_1002407 [Scenedesmus sp. NREL 46B-D3]|nr:hypothetical protein COO60DRAFT_1002407 [Scenedesmus sp. NREL 46B-D3]